MRKQRAFIQEAISCVHRAAHCPRRRLVVCEILEGRALLSATYVVNTTDDSGTAAPGQMSLRQAILAVNANGSPDVIQFNIPAAGLQTIHLNSPLPIITNAVSIDATTQPGYVGTPLVELSGKTAGAGSGLNFAAGSDGSFVKGLEVDGFTGAGIVLGSGGNSVSNNVISGNTLDGIYVTGSGNTIQSNRIGTDLTGTLAKPNGADGSAFSAGIWVDGAVHTLIGGPAASLGNLVSGNARDGIAFSNATVSWNTVQNNLVGLDAGGINPLGNGSYGVDLGTFRGLSVSFVSILGNTISANFSSGIHLSAASNNIIQGNLIGTDAFGNEAFDLFDNPIQANFGDGITIASGSSGNLIGGLTAASRNVISGNDGNGITLAPGVITAANTIQGNYIGTDGTGLLANGNGADGIHVNTGLAIIGGASAGAGNVISSNFGFGLTLSAGSTRVQGNIIGAGADRTTNLGNYGNGIYINSSNNVIGGEAFGAGNLVAFNGLGGSGRGVDVFVGTQNAIQGNSIFSNAKLGIDLDQNGVTLNDSSAAPAANLDQEFPVISSAVLSGGNVTLAGSLHSAPNSTFSLDFFSNLAADPTGYGEGQTYAGSTLVSTDSFGNLTFVVSFVAADPQQAYWSATATDALGNTSEFALTVLQTTPPPPVQTASATAVTSSADPSVLGQSVTFTATVTGSGATPTGSINFYDGTTLLASVPLSAGLNHASFTTSGLSVSTHTITASYSGDSGYFSSSATLSEEVDRAATTTKLTASQTPSSFQQTLTFKAVVSASVNGITPTGTVTFMDGSAVLGTATLDSSGAATFSTGTVSVGTHTVTAMYNSDGNFSASVSNTLTQQVNAVLGSISGVVYRDLTGDGLSSDDQPMSGVTVQLLRVVNGAATVVTSTTSDANGIYRFTNLVAGKYQVQELAPKGYARTAPKTSPYSVTVSGGTVVTNENFDNFDKSSHSRQPLEALRLLVHQKPHR